MLFLYPMDHGIDMTTVFQNFKLWCKPFGREGQTDIFPVRPACATLFILCCRWYIARSYQSYSQLPSESRTRIHHPLVPSSESFHRTTLRYGYRGHDLSITTQRKNVRIVISTPTSGQSQRASTPRAESSVTSDPATSRPSASPTSSSSSRQPGAPSTSTSSSSRP